MSRDDRLRLTADGADETVVELLPGEVPAAVGPQPEVRAVTPSRADQDAGRRRFEVTVDGWVIGVGVESAVRAALRERAAQAAARSGPSGRIVVRAQIPGRVVRLWVAAGEIVEAGQRLLAIEAMKMENEVRAPQAGRIESVAAVVATAVELGDELVVIE